MDPKVQILHKLLVSNFVQRGAKPSYVQHEDLLILDKLLNKEKVNLPKLMIYQMHHIKNLSQIGFSRVIKKILQVHGLYNANTESEVPVVKKSKPDMFRKMKLVKVPELGWIRTSVAEKPEKQGFDFVDEDENPDEVSDLVLGSGVAQRLRKVEKGWVDLKSEVRDLKSEVRELKEELKDELREFRNRVLGMLTKFCGTSI